MRSRGDKLAATIAQSIESDIIGRSWPIGESLGSEPALIERFGVSRAVMREAVRILESRGIARMRLGPGGGLTVTAPRPELAVESVGLLLDHANVTPRDLFEARSAVEVMCVALAAERIDEAGIERVRGALNSDLDLAVADAVEVANNFHLAIAEASGNPALHLLAEILVALMAEISPQILAREGAIDDMHREHAGIAAAVVAGDSPLAQHLMRRHLASMLGAALNSE